MNGTIPLPPVDDMERLKQDLVCPPEMENVYAVRLRHGGGIDYLTKEEYDKIMNPDKDETDRV